MLRGAEGTRIDLTAEPKPNVLPALLSPQNLLLGIKSRGKDPTHTPAPEPSQPQPDQQQPDEQPQE